MACGRTTSKGQGTSGRLRSPEGSFTSEQLEGGDDALDGIAPDDLPVRDISEEDDDWPSPDEAGTEDLSEPRRRPTDAPAVAADSFAAAGGLSACAASPSTPDQREPTPDVSNPVASMRSVVFMAPPPRRRAPPHLRSCGCGSCWAGNEGGIPHVRAPYLAVPGRCDVASEAGW